MTRRAKSAALKQDWAKVNEGSPLEEEIVGLKTPERQNDGEASDGKQPVPRQFNSGEESLADSDDDELLMAEERLRLLKVEEEKLTRKEKMKEIVEETRRLQNSIKGRKKKSRAKEKQLTSASLRGRSEVVNEVDKLMDSKKLNFREEDESSSASEESESPSSASSSSEEEKSRKKKEKRKKKSGKEKKLTSYVKYPQKWPHSHLKFHFVSKDKRYDDLSIPEFCAGYMSILQSCKSSQMKHRIAHLEELMYHATTKPWKCVLNYHAACLLEIERGNLKWGDNFQLQGLQNTTLYAGQSLTNNSSRNNNGGFGSDAGNFSQKNNGSGERVWFCRNYQKGVCTFSRDHYGQLKGENQMLKHICATCWLASKKQSTHPEESEVCPFHKAKSAL